MSRAKITELLGKVDHYDPDERFMAVSDLSNELQKDVQIDSSLERRICTAILDRLSSDPSNDVSAMSVKCLSALMKRAKDTQIKEVCSKLCDHLLHGKEDLRDIYSIGLQTIITDSPTPMGPIIVSNVTPSLLRGISGAEAADVKVKTECMDVLGHLLKRCGNQMGDFRRDIMETLLRQLSDRVASIRKRATSCLASLAVVLPDNLLQSMVETLLASIGRAGTVGEEQVRLVQTIGSVSRRVGFRLGRHLPRIVPLFLGFMGSPDDEDQHTDEANDLRETCLQAFESFVLRCPAEVTDFVDRILNESVLPFLAYDPNYTYMSSDDEDMDDFDDNDSLYDSDPDMSAADDDDTSWKVRRAAIKVLAALIRTRSEMLRELFAASADVLVDRFKEREDSVKQDILHCFTDLLHAVQASDTSSARTGAASSAPSGLMSPSRALTRASAGAADVASELLADKLVSIVASARKVLETKGSTLGKAKSKMGMFATLRELSLVVGSGLSAHIGSLLPPAQACLTDKNASLRLEALQFVHALLVGCNSGFGPFLDQLVPTVVACVDAEWYKITAESLRVIGRLACVIRPLDAAGNLAAPEVDPRAYVRMLYMALMPRLSAHDIDQEIKECAIVSMGLVIARLGDLLGPMLASSLPVFVERLRNEITRLAAIKALAAVASSPLALDLSSILSDTVVELKSFLRQQSRALRQASLSLLCKIIDKHASRIPGAKLAEVVNEAARMINDDDLQLCQLALDVCVSSVTNHNEGGDMVTEKVLPAAMTVAASNLLQGAALSSMLALFKQLPRVKAPGLDSASLLAALYAAGEAVQRQSLGNLASCVAAVCTSLSTAEQNGVVSSIVSAISSGASERTQYLHLLCLGEIGMICNVPASNPECYAAIIASFAATNDSIKAASAFALGGVCVGDLRGGMKVILDNLTEGTHSYLLLSALKEVLVRHVAMPAAFEAQIDPVLTSLEANCESKDEGIRNMAADCLGKVAAISPDTVFPRLVALARSGSAYARWTVATTVKYAATSAAARARMAADLGVFLEFLRDEDLDVRRASLLSLNALVHHDAKLVEPFLISAGPEEGDESKDADLASTPLATMGVLPILYYEMIPRKELVREMDYGPFKHKIDDGLDLRKASFACIEGILEFTDGEAVNPAKFLPRLRDGLKDHDDVQMQCHQLLVKLLSSRAWQGHVVSDLVNIADLLDRVITKMEKKSRGKSSATGSETVRSALRAIDAISRVADAQGVKRFIDLLHRVEHREPMASLLASIRMERNGSSAHAEEARGSGAGAGAGAGAGSRRRR